MESAPANCATPHPSSGVSWRRRLRENGIVSSYGDRLLESALAQGRKNAETIELARRHCLHMTFTESGGQGFAEEATGLPINSRRVHCSYGQGGASGDLDWIASDFYEEHCVGCEHRQPTGEVPNLATIVEERNQAAATVAEAQQVETVRAAAAWGERLERRRALIATSDPAMAGALEDIGVLDSEPATDTDPGATEAALRRLIVLSERAADAFTDAVVDHAIDLVETLGLSSLIGPLRHVARNRVELADRILEAALGSLRQAPQIEAGRCLMDLSKRLKADALDAAVVRSLAYLAGMRTVRIPGRSGQARSHEPGPLRVAADLAPGAVEAVLRRMLPSPTAGSGLALLPGYAGRSYADRDAEGDRAAAAESVRALASTHPEVATALVSDLVLNLGVDGDDDYDKEPIGNVKRALATMLILEIGDVGTAVETAGRNTSEEIRTRLFDVYEIAARSMHTGDSGRAPGDPQTTEERARAVLDELVTIAFTRVSGDWGENVAFSGARLVHQLARARPQWVIDGLDSILGAFLGTIDSMSNPPRRILVVGTEPATPFAGMEAFARRNSYSSAARELLSALVRVARHDVLTVCSAITQVIADERDNERGVEVVWRLLPVLGKIASAHGGEPAVLRSVLPTMHTYLVDAEPALRAAALEAWTEIGRVHRLPSSLADLLPAFLNDATIGVIGALLGAARRLQWAGEDEARLLLRAIEVCRLIDAESHPELLKSSMATVAALAGDGDDGFRVHAEQLILRRAASLDGYDLRDVLRGRWLPSTAQSGEIAALRLRQARDPRINDRFNASDDDELCALLDSGAGIIALPLDDLVAAALDLAPDWPLGSAEFAEVAWRAGRVEDAASVLQAILSATPDVPAYDGHRAFLELLLHATGLDLAAAATGDLSPAVDALVPAIAAVADGAGEVADHLCSQVRARIEVRYLLRSETVPPVFGPSDRGSSTRPSSSEIRRAHADQLTESAGRLDASSQRATATGAYLRAFAGLCLVGADLLRLDAAELDADTRAFDAHAVAARRRAGELRAELESRFNPDDPLAGPLIAALGSVDAVEDGTAVPSALAAWSTLHLPLVVVNGPRRRIDRWLRSAGVGAPEEIEDEVPTAAVVFASVDGHLITGPQVLRPSQVYELRLEVRPGPWPEWADHLDAELLGHLSDADIQTPTFTWARSAGAAGEETLSGSGTLVLRFGLAAGQPAPPFLVNLRWRGNRHGDPTSQALDVAGHSQLRFRPFDASRDFLTEFPVFDERLLALYERLHGARYDEEHLQAFCRLFTAVCRIGLRMTWDKKYKRGTSISERTFHDDLYERLLAEPELDGRLNRGTPLALGFLDVRHDKVTAELKVERKTPVTRESAPKYMGQPTQYAAADGARLSILCILDMSQKTSPVGTPENYMFTLEPALHGLNNPEAPSLVAEIVVNGNLPTPSTWSRRKSAVRTPST